MQSVQSLFEEQVRQGPERIAVVKDDEQISYGELNRRANQVANYLREAGVMAEELVGICLERSVEMMIGVLGVLKAGGAYVPLDAGYPAERIKFMIEDARVQTVITHASTVEKIPENTIRIICADVERRMIAQRSSESPANENAPESLAYVIYTSGSTGVPKGVAITRRSVANLMRSMAETPGLMREDVLLGVTTLSFDLSVPDVYLPLIVGGRLVIAGREIARDGAKLAVELAEVGATAMAATPSSWRMLVDAGWEGSRRFKIMSGGEALGRDLAEELKSRAGEVWNLYGPTETTVWATLTEVKEVKGVVEIGRPISNTEVYLLDEGLNAAPAGVAGELYIGGVGLARGYLNRAEQTAEHFIPHPYSERSGERLYRTGDRGRYQEDGQIEYLGRVDGQVKVRGFRVEVGEIEAAIMENGGIKECVVVAREDESGAMRLIAYIALEPGEMPRPGELRRQLKKRLPEYMAPSAFAVLDSLPLTLNGKVDRKALTTMDGARLILSEEYVAPRTPIERMLCRIWEEVLKVEQVGVENNFFDLGGHSLLATQVISRVQEICPLDIRVLFERPTIAGLAIAIDEARAEQEGEDESKIFEMLEELSEDQLDAMLMELSSDD